MQHIHKQTSRENNGKYDKRAVTYVSALQSGTLGGVVTETDVDNVSVSMLDGHKSMQKKESKTNHIVNGWFRKQAMP